MGRYLRIYKKSMLINLKALLIYDRDFIVGIVAMLIKLVAKFSMLLVLFTIITEIDGWNFYEILFIYGFSSMSYSIWDTFFINTVTIPVYIKSGEMEGFLTKPLHPLFLIILEGFDDDGWGGMILSIIITIISISHLNINLWLLLLLPILWISTSIIYTSISILLSTVSFVTVGNADLTGLSSDLSEFAKYPLTIYNRGMRILFSTVLPIGFLGMYPSMIFVKGVNTYTVVLVIISIIFSAFFFWLSCKIWNLGLKRYTGSGI